LQKKLITYAFFWPDSFCKWRRADIAQRHDQWFSIKMSINLLFSRFLMMCTKQKYYYYTNAHKDLLTTLTAFSFVFIANNFYSSSVFAGIEPMLVAIKIFSLFLQQIVGWDSLLRLHIYISDAFDQSLGKIASCLLKYCGIRWSSGYSRSASRSTALHNE
jgi:hypothetical protein